jgi:hypothetical protein
MLKRAFRHKRNTLGLEGGKPEGGRDIDLAAK